MSLRFGVVLPPRPGVERVVAEAEALGFASAWVYDTPMVHAHPFVHLTACALATDRITLGTGVTSPRLRSVGDAAVGFASLNALAPGRVVMGIGTGNTGRRCFGMPPVPLAELETFIEQFRSLLTGGEIAYTENGRTALMRLLHEPGYINVEDPIPVVVAAAGPGAATLAGTHGDGLLSFGFVDPQALTQLRGLVEQGRASAGRAAEPSSVHVMTAVHVCEQDRRHDAEARDAVGHIVLSLLRYVVQNPGAAALLSPAGQEAARRLAASDGGPGDDPARAHQRLYRNYLGRIRPEERDLIIPELIDACAISGDAAWCNERLDALGEAGVTDVVIHPTLDPIAELHRFHDTVMAGRVGSASAS